jgi:hypothetical protein
VTRRAIGLISFSTVLCLFLLTVESSAAIYRYVDKDGVPSYADDLQSVPKEFRQKAVIVSGELKEEELRSAPPEILDSKAEIPAYEAVGEHAASASFSRRLARSILILLAMVPLFIILKQKIEPQRELVASRIRTALFGILVLYLFIAHAKDVVVMAGLTGDKVEEAKRKSGEKGRKAAEAIKALDAAMEMVTKETGTTIEKVKNSGDD